MFAFSRALYNGSYTMAVKPVKSFELHYTMIQFRYTMFEKYRLLNGAIVVFSKLNQQDLNINNY